MIDTKAGPVEPDVHERMKQVFATVSQHMLNQARRAVMHGHSGALTCVYRLIDGRACAVGCLIRPEHYHASLERQNTEAAEVCTALAASLGYPLVAIEVGLLRALQRVHDIELAAWGDDSGIPAWAIIGPLNRVAVEFGLPLLPRAANTPAGV